MSTDQLGEQFRLTNQLETSAKELKAISDEIDPFSRTMKDALERFGMNDIEAIVNHKETLRPLLHEHILQNSYGNDDIVKKVNTHYLLVALDGFFDDCLHLLIRAKLSEISEKCQPVCQ